MYRKVPSGWMKHFDFMLIDLISFCLAYVWAYHIRHVSSSFVASELYRAILVIVLFLSVLISVLADTNKNVLRRGYYQEFLSVVQHGAYVIICAITYLFLAINSGEYSRTVMILMGVIYVCFSFIGKSLWKYYLKRYGMAAISEKSLIIVTNSDLIGRIAENIRNNNYAGYVISGIAVVDQNMVGEEIEGIPVKANKNTVIEYVRRSWVDEVFINIPSTDVTGEQWVQTFAEMGITVHLRLMHANDLDPKYQFVQRVGRYTVLTTAIGTVRVEEMIAKRCIDICAGIVGCIITAVLFVIVGPIIYIKSPGPIFFAQTRIGKNGHKFKIYKFRSMYMDAEERKKEMMEENQVKDGMMFKVAFDKRIIGSEKGPDKGIGNFIRKYSIDEWPQFLNILIGDMSLVGTRPPTVDEWDKYEAHHRARLATKPGLTGMWQVSGRSKITDFEEVVKLDMMYITDWKLKDDIKILFKTVWVVLKREGAM